MRTVSVIGGALLAGLMLLSACGDDSSNPGAGSGGSAGASGSAGSSGSAGAGGSSGSAGSAGSSGSGGSSGTLPNVGGCDVFSGDDDWNRDVSSDPVDDTWTQRVQALVGSKNIHPDYGNAGNEMYGIPVNVVPQNQPAVPIVFDWWPDESDPGPYPFPDPGSIKIEGNSPMSCSGDCHVLVVQQGTCMLYEGYACEYQGGSWHCGNGAKWDLTKLSYGQRPKGWTSADAAGLPIMPGVIRYDEAKAGAIKHAIRFTLSCTVDRYVKPATHQAVPGNPPCTNGEPDSPPMGLRVRLKSSYSLAGVSGTARAVLEAMKTYGMILADNGSDFYFQGEAHAGWKDSDLDPLKAVPASEFEVIKPPPLEGP